MRRPAYGVVICAGCGRICDDLLVDDRCNDCGPLPLTPEEKAAYAEDAERARKRREDQWGRRATARPIPEH